MNYLDCFKDMHDELSAAECIHCLQKFGETILYDDDKKRLVMWREIYDKEPEEYMKKLTEIFKIDSREKYEEIDKEYNLTMY